MSIPSWLGRARLPAWPLLLLGALGAASSGCLSYTSSPLDLSFDISPPGVQLSSAPTGASIWIGGRDSGFTTPCVLDLDQHRTQVVEYRLPGYASAVRVLEPNGRVTLVPWPDGDTSGIKWRFPLWLPLGDFFVPIKYNSAHSPWRVHVNLRLTQTD